MTIKYTPEQEIELKEGYEACNTHDERDDFMLKFGYKHDKSKRSLVAKIAKMRNDKDETLYISRPKVSKVTGDKAKTKDQMVTEMTTKMGFSTDELEGLDKTPKLVLVKVSNRLDELFMRIKELEDKLKSI